MKQTHFTTTLVPSASYDSKAGRQPRGLATATLTNIEKVRSNYRVPSQSNDGFYIINLDHPDGPTCSCPKFKQRRSPCKHIYQSALALQRGEPVEGEADDKDEQQLMSKKRKKKTYSRNWSAYDRAQNHELEHFEVLLRVLCDRIEQPFYEGQGRPALPASDMVYCLVYKVYQQLSRRRVMTDIRRVHERGFIDEVPSDSAVSRYMNRIEMIPALKYLVAVSAWPLAEIENAFGDSFGIDSTGFATTYYDRYFDAKRGRSRKRARFVKAHIMVGHKTHIATAAEVSIGDQHDSPLLPHLLRVTEKGFNIDNLCGDKAYMDHLHFERVEGIGGQFFSLFKDNAAPLNPGKREQDAWDRAHEYFIYRRKEFMEHYHQRSNAETPFSMTKLKTGPAIKSRNQTAQFTEVLCKLVAHNIMVLIHEAYKLGIESELDTWVREAIDRQEHKRQQRLDLAA